MRKALAALVVISSLCLAGEDQLGSEPGGAPTLWVAIGTAKPIYALAELGTIAISFAVVNDGNAVVNPNVESSHLFINGVEPPDWSFVIGNGIRSSFFTALPPGELLSFNYQLGPRYFAAPGIYTVTWRLGKARSSEMTFRVMPAAK